MPFERLDDRMMVFDSMVSEMHEAGDYNIRASQSSNKQLVELFNKIHAEEQVHIHLYTDAMSQRGWESPLQTNPQDVAKAQNEGRTQGRQMSQQAAQPGGPGGARGGVQGVAQGVPAGPGAPPGPGTT